VSVGAMGDSTAVEKYRCYAKVNFILRVVGKRPDGYHDIDSLMQTVDLADEVTIDWKRSALAVECSEPSLAGRSNLAWRAARLFLDASGLGGGPRIVVKKRIPVAAGLGGGSSDAACVLAAMAARYGPPPGGLAELALRVGSDVPYLLVGGLCRVRGRGERVEPLEGPGPLDIVLGTPPLEIRSSWAYGRLRLPLTPEAERRSIVGLDTALADAEGLSGALRNDLEEAVIDSFPAVRVLIERMKELGALGVVMSGSGPTVLALVGDRAQAERMAGLLAADGYRAFAVRTTNSARSACD